MLKTDNISVQQPLGRILSHLGRNYLRLLNARLNHLDIERNYYALLLIDIGAGNITQNELASNLESDKVSVVRIIDYLTANGYVIRVRSITDKRKYCLTLTEKGKNAIPGIKQAMDEVTAIALEGLDKNQKLSFFISLDSVKQNFKKANTRT